MANNIKTLLFLNDAKAVSRVQYLYTKHGKDIEKAIEAELNFTPDEEFTQLNGVKNLYKEWSDINRVNTHVGRINKMLFGAATPLEAKEKMIKGLYYNKSFSYDNNGYLITYKSPFIDAEGIPEALTRTGGHIISLSVSENLCDCYLTEYRDGAKIRKFNLNEKLLHLSISKCGDAIKKDLMERACGLDEEETKEMLVSGAWSKAETFNLLEFISRASTRAIRDASILNIVREMFRYINRAKKAMLVSKSVDMDLESATTLRILEEMPWMLDSYIEDEIIKTLDSSGMPKDILAISHPAIYIPEINKAIGTVWCVGIEE